jgi:polyferredoxin
VVFVAGPNFLGSNSGAFDEARPRHATTRMREPTRRWKAFLRNALLVLLGMILGVLLWSALERFTPHWPAPANEPHAVKK